ncbi:hypothetical protein V8F20_003190 [Naviculisporaceae sp. PSN 640]
MQFPSIMASSNSDPTDRIEQGVNEKSMKSRFRKENIEFMPEGELSEIITADVVRDMLGEYAENDTEWEDLETFILTKAIKVFTITVLIGIEDEKLHKAMVLFKRNGFRDDSLPIQRIELGKGRQEHPFDSLHLGWKDSKILNFYKVQWTFIAHVIHAATGERRSNADLEDRRILPFIERFDEGCDKGSFGQVTKYRVHPKHLDDPEQPLRADEKEGRCVAVKELQPRAEDKQKLIANWEREANVLQKMNAFRQENIVRFITAFRRGEKGQEDYYLVFEWADGGNLTSLWKTWKRPFLTGKLTKAVVRQILGLATALCAAHYPASGPTTLSFRHGDLKPENILWFKGPSGDEGDIGTLKIADWGLAKQHNIETELRSNKTSMEHGTRRYESPEEDTGQGIGLTAPSAASTKKPQKKRSRLYDVWAMGCITLEFIVWLIYGLDGLKQFNSEIKTDANQFAPYYQTIEKNGRKSAEIHPAVARWMDCMAKLPVCEPGSTALGGLLELVRTRLLVTDLPVGLGGTFSSSPKLEAVSPNSSPAGASPTTPKLGMPPRQASSPLPTHLDDGPSQKIPQIVVSDMDATTNPQATTNLITPPASPPRDSKPKSLSKPSLGRAKSDEFVQRMEEIFYADENDASYWGIETSTPDPTPPGGAESSTSPFFLPLANHEEYHTECNSTGAGSSVPPTTTRTGNSKRRAFPSGDGLLSAVTQRVDYGSSALDTDWNITIDNAFATELWNTLKTLEGSNWENPSTPSDNLCEKCLDLQENIWDLSFEENYSWPLLRSNAESKTCDLCALLWRTCQQHSIIGSRDILVTRVGSSLVINSNSSVTLSIFRSPELKTRADDTTQIGFGPLFPANSEAHFAVLRQWLAQCDRNANNLHSSCCHQGQGSFSLSPSAKKPLPTRVLEVGSPGSQKVRLIATTASQTGRWLALSYQWGPAPHFRTTTDNVHSYLSDGIDFDSLPGTFRDAVIVTRALGVPYLWIDSLCIVQGPGGDFNQEAKKMEQVYSGAYCVLAISWGNSHYAGFLPDGHARKTEMVTFCPKDQTSPQPSFGRLSTTKPGTFYITPKTANFPTDVLDSPLSRRGWVLQEHALARRTIFFTTSSSPTSPSTQQTYFQCGAGVRCETGHFMTNSIASFRGDPNFPNILLASKQAEKIIQYQTLYKDYSRLGLTRAYDRPMAIGGLQDRLIAALGCKGGWGVFDEGRAKKGMLRRSLLWIRDREEATGGLKRIEFPILKQEESTGLATKVPSWSWMAVEGPIDYVVPQFGTVDWEDIESPWSGGSAFPATSGLNAASGNSGLTVKGALTGKPSPTGIGNYKSPGPGGVYDIALIAEAREYSIPVEEKQGASNVGNINSSTGVGQYDSDQTVRPYQSVGKYTDNGELGKGEGEPGPEILAVFDDSATSPATQSASRSGPGTSSGMKALCVVLGKQKGAMDRKLKRHYVIFVMPASVPVGGSANGRHSLGKKVYERVGAGYLPGRCINWERAAVRVTIH